MILHLHGSVDDPWSLVLPGESLEELRGDEPFKVILRALLLPHVIVYFGYRLPPADEYLREEIAWLAGAFADHGTHALLLPADEYVRRRDGFTSLAENADVQVETFDAELGFQAVHQAALIVAPSAEVGDELVRTVRSQDIAEYFHPPALLIERNDEQDDPGAALALARFGFADPVVSLAQLRAERRALVTAEPGMGKTQLLFQLGKEEMSGHRCIFRSNNSLTSCGVRTGSCVPSSVPFGTQVPFGQAPLIRRLRRLTGTRTSFSSTPSTRSRSTIGRRRSRLLEN